MQSSRKSRENSRSGVVWIEGATEGAANAGADCDTTGEPIRIVSVIQETRVMQFWRTEDT